MSFSALAPFYRPMEFFLAGEKLQRARLQFISELAGARRILLAGEGPGRFLRECAKRFPDAHITVIDDSAKMLEVARRKIPASARVEFIHANLLNWKCNGPPFDAVVSHFFLDCFAKPTLSRVVSNLAAALVPGGKWLLADFQIPESGWQRKRAIAIHAMMYGFFRVATNLPARWWVNPDPALQANGLILKARRFTELGLVHSDFWQHEATEIGIRP
jgi:ubiquinone/menaquinone biosynthesis C-methylase UbiE